MPKKSTISETSMKTYDLVAEQQHCDNRLPNASSLKSNITKGLKHSHILTVVILYLSNPQKLTV